MNRLEVVLLLSVASMVFILELVALVQGIDGTKLGIALAILGTVVGYIGKSIVFYSKKK